MQRGDVKTISYHNVFQTVGNQCFMSGTDCSPLCVVITSDVLVELNFSSVAHVSPFGLSS